MVVSHIFSHILEEKGLDLVLNFFDVGTELRSTTCIIYFDVTAVSGSTPNHTYLITALTERQ